MADRQPLSPCRWLAAPRAQGPTEPTSRRRAGTPAPALLEDPFWPRPVEIEEIVLPPPCPRQTTLNGRGSPAPILYSAFCSLTTKHRSWTTAASGSGVPTSLIGVPNGAGKWQPFSSGPVPWSPSGAPVIPPALGAARLYVSNDRWQSRVSPPATRAQPRCGDPDRRVPGPGWEIRPSTGFRATHRPQPVRAVRSRSRLKSSPDSHHCWGTNGLIPCRSHPPSGLRAWGWWTWRRRVGSLVFPHGASSRGGSDGELPVALRRGRTSSSCGRRTALRRAWREVFRCLGSDSWDFRSPPRTLAALLALFFGGSGVHWFYISTPTPRLGLPLLFPFGLVSLPAFGTRRALYLDGSGTLSRAAVPASTRTAATSCLRQAPRHLVDTPSWADVQWCTPAWSCMRLLGTVLFHPEPPTQCRPFLFWGLLAGMVLMSALFCRIPVPQIVPGQPFTVPGRIEAGILGFWDPDYFTFPGNRSRTSFVT